MSAQVNQPVTKPLCDVINEDLPKLDLDRPRMVGMGLQIFNSNPKLRFRIEGCGIPFAPSVYNGTGAEERKNIQLSVTEVEAAAIESMEKAFMKQLESSSISTAQLASVVKRNDKYNPSLRAKINTAGVQPCRFWDADGNATAAPAQWKCIANAVLEVRGVWSSKTGAGLTLQVTDLQCSAPTPAQCPFGGSAA